MGRTAAEQVVNETTIAIDAAESPRAKLAAGIEAYLSVASSPVRSCTDLSIRHRDLGDYVTIVGLHATGVIAELMEQAGDRTGAAESGASASSGWSVPPPTVGSNIAP